MTQKLLLPEIIDIVRDSILEGLVDESIELFDEKMLVLDDYQKEQYLQTLWDEI